LFTPLLHEVATGSLTPSSVAEPLREIFAGDRIEVVRGEAEKIHLDSRVVTIGGRDFPYDYLVLASGAQNTDCGVPGAAEHALPLKRLADALKIRRTVIGAFERLASALAERPRLPRLAVVGGGATGVELAAELAEFADAIGGRYYPHVRAVGPTVTLVDGGTTLLPSFPRSVSRAAERSLAEAGVAVCHGCKIASVTAAGIERAAGGTVLADAVFWCAGVAPALPPFEGVLEVSDGRVAVDAALRATTRPEVFALGDVAAVLGEDGRPLPMLAQVAIQQAKSVARNVLAAARGKAAAPFRYRSKGSLVSLGRHKAAGVVLGIPISGPLAWFIWRNTYLFKFASWKKRLRIGFEWFIGLFFARETTEA
ncbi:MAG TPA: NAD(P)/FAD-dependent oxidoreductase, partial [Candidatus Paceibacterota bacterium]